MQTISEVRDRVTANAKPLLNTAIEKTGPVLTSAIQRAIGVVERIDPEASNREAYFKTKEQEQPAVEDAAAVSSSQHEDAAAPQEENKMSTSVEQPAAESEETRN